MIGRGGGLGLLLSRLTQERKHGMNRKSNRILRHPEGHSQRFHRMLTIAHSLLSRMFHKKGFNRVRHAGNGFAHVLSCLRIRNGHLEICNIFTT